jgi:collagen beta-1,O-galactosyltransferase
LKEQGDKYFSINVTLDEKTQGHIDENGIADWTSSRFEHIIKLREEVLNYARNMWADYLFVCNIYSQFYDN